MTTIKIWRLPHVEDEVLLGSMSQPLRRLRLQSLQTDAAVFESKYSDEVKQPTEFWINRIKDTDADHWLAYDTSSQENIMPFEAELGGKIVGCIVLLTLGQSHSQGSTSLVETTTEDCDNYMIGCIYVDPSYRGRGISKKLMASALDSINHLWQDQLRKIVVKLSVRRFNKNAIRLYEKFGFEKSSLESEEVGDNGEREIMDVMRLELVPSLSREVRG